MRLFGKRCSVDAPNSSRNKVDRLDKLAALNVRVRLFGQAHYRLVTDNDFDNGRICAFHCQLRYAGMSCFVDRVRHT